MKKSNRLLKEKSPYLLQHAFNPVDWYPWGDEAFKKAKDEDKPIFLSIGYSTCHWCHVMEKESFEDEEVAALMNDTFVSIKVDREERPDIDGIYMSVCQMLTGSGGWPLTIVMTPDKKPFFAGTYFSKGERFGRPGMTELVPRLKDIWLTRREDVLKSADEISDAVAQASSFSSEDKLQADIFDKAYSDFNKRFDKAYGGFGNAPKFPTPHNLCLLLRYWKNSTSPDSIAAGKNALNMVEKTLTSMRMGGIYDHIGFGFHRYSTDSKWLVPHFEKMLYDQALLIIAYTEAWQATKKDIYKQTAEEVIEYVLRDMTSLEGGFYSAEDADSEGVEGKFYLWSVKEIKNILSPEEGEFVIKIFNITEEGNWVDPVHGSPDGTNILHLQKSLPDIAIELNISESDLTAKLNSIRKILFERREKREHPYKDDKILTDWNGLMISALSKAAQVFNKPEYSDAAEKAVKFILDSLMDKNQRLMHRYRDGEAGLPAHIDDYAFLVAGLLDLYEAVFNPDYLKIALNLNEVMLNHFRDIKSGAFFFTADDSEELIARQKEIYDGAIPSGNSVAISNLIRLSRITGETSFENKANGIAQAFSKNINSMPSAFSQALIGVNFAASNSYEIIIAGEKSSSGTKAVLEYIRNKFIPNKIVLLKDSESGEQISGLAPYSVNYKAANDAVSVFVCQNFRCSLPVSTVEELQKLI